MLINLWESCNNQEKTWNKYRGKDFFLKKEQYKAIFNYICFTAILIISYLVEFSSEKNRYNFDPKKFQVEKLKC